MMTGTHEWRSAHKNDARRGIRVSLLHIDSSGAPQVRTIVTVWTKAGNFSFKVADAEKEPILAPEYGFFVRAGSSSAGTLIRSGLCEGPGRAGTQNRSAARARASRNDGGGGFSGVVSEGVANPVSQTAD